MKTLILYSCIAAFLLSCTLAEAKDGHHPVQVHLSLGTDETEMLVTWVVKSGSVHDTPTVEYGPSEGSLHLKATAEETHFKEDRAEFRTFRALMTGLTAGGSTVYYRVGSPATAWSRTFHFRTLSKSSSNTWLPRLAIYGDLGYTNAQSTPYLVKEVAAGHFDALFHIGDFAYDLHSKDGERGHEFMEMIEPIAAQVPYMTIPGNHEEHANFSHYDARFSMLADRHQPAQHKEGKPPLNHRLNNHYHSMTVGPVTVIMINTEYYYYTGYGWGQISRQYEWLEEELKRANANRAIAPWVVVMGHRPLYCLKKKDKKAKKVVEGEGGGGDADDDDAGECDIEAMERPALRKGVKMHGSGSNLQYGLEDLFFKYGVDLYFAGHEHHYGRTTPLYDQRIRSGHRSPSNPYDDPAGPVHFITGAAGNKQEHGSFNKHPKSWLLHTSPDYGYTRLSFKSRLHLVLEQTSDEKGGAVIDKIELIKYQNSPTWANLP